MIKYSLLLSGLFASSFSTSLASNITVPNVIASTTIPTVIYSASFYNSGLTVVNGSGLSELGHHVNVAQHSMWLSTGDGVFGGVDSDPYIIFDFGAVYDVSKMHVWNYNGAEELDYLKRGVNSVIVQYGTTLVGQTLGGTTGTVNEITNFAQADGSTSYAGEEFQFLTPFSARYVKFDINSNYGDVNSFYGLSEVQFTAVPEPRAYALLVGALALMVVTSRRRRTR